MASKYSLADIIRFSTMPSSELTPYKRRLVRHLPELEAGTLSRSQIRGHARIKYGEQPIVERLGLPKKLKQPKLPTPTSRPIGGFKQLAAKHGGDYHGPSRTSERSKSRWHSATFKTLDDAIAFAKDLPLGNQLYIRQYGYVVRTHKDRKTGKALTPGKFEDGWRTISQLMTPDYVPVAEQDVRDNSKFFFLADDKAENEYIVVWRKLPKQPESAPEVQDEE